MKRNVRLLQGEILEMQLRRKQELAELERRAADPVRSDLDMLAALLTLGIISTGCLLALFFW